ncbi:hypothetical protein RhiirA5_452048 [Rhizophagus irregularis]|uniref:TNFR-Cys domain-containing protein n=3 Tax=Rhizophagus irregularis TaxID=588596 RepID=A0A2N0P8L9_9GLOM|nr:hypothetical protein GLOIN_2v1881112 [Rhizophagus irregularis DAOM 181602=DAOM 197198]EXX77647.1 hypothetical protein RirG_021960 [Rhizophagus irregularis DAOM 197198w]PKC03168.1 hypothetical protein RhiirA5_452048 [Rhizophagus irregularis]PKC72041.1 hypothetical protein RhiirA1_493982 [Rhizophagus irregularis]POG64740.1 hypothetical protein GLOIN_2v1881112 [Rhizophagus irregularis DAOM 181602=DAOM 197198]UZO12186.1 hypothetical protein OCT59_003734 [Rhizophagus irregularis]|eukprot:XP_025171606.1 hypothetical protein GLOIN_2v1881112 [Rhizophagus irregularis DAOM 181602=DAOM 197198]
MSKCQIIYTIFLLLTLGLFLGIFFGLGYPEIKRAEYISTYCTINSKTISTKYCCYAECSNCETASELAPKCTDLESKWNSLSPDTCTNAVLTNSSLADVCPINDLKGECNGGYYCCSTCCSPCCSNCSCTCSCCSDTSRLSCQLKCPICYSVVLTVTLQKRDNWSYTPITTNITTEFRENINGAEQFLADYSISSTVQCFYNPKDPFQAFLNVNFAAKTWVAVGITAFFLTITLMIGTWILFSENNTILQDYKYRVLIMEIALWCGTIIPPLLILIDLIPFTNGKVLWTLAVIGVALGWAPVHTAACMKKRGWRFISAFTVTIITLILPLIMFSIAAIYALSTDIRTYMIILAIVIPLGVNIIIFVLWDLCVKYKSTILFNNQYKGK